jgi:hypothetical protein
VAEAGRSLSSGPHFNAAAGTSLGIQASGFTYVMVVANEKIVRESWKEKLSLRLGFPIRHQHPVA